MFKYNTMACNCTNNNVYSSLKRFLSISSSSTTINRAKVRGSYNYVNSKSVSSVSAVGVRQNNCYHPSSLAVFHSLCYSRYNQERTISVSKTYNNIETNNYKKDNKEAPPSSPLTLSLDLSTETILSLSKRAYELSIHDLEIITHHIESINQYKGDFVHENDQFTLTKQNVVYVHKLMKACSQFHTVKGAALAERLLIAVVMNYNKHIVKNNNCEENYEHNQISSGGPTAKMYSIAMNAWAQLPKHQLQSKDGNLNLPGEKTCKILEFMWHEYNNARNDNIDGDTNKSNVSVVKPDVMHYTIALNAISRMSSKRAVYLAQFLLDDAESKSGVSYLLSEADKHDDKTESKFDPNLVPDRFCYNKVLYIWSQYFNLKNDSKTLSSSNRISEGSNRNYYPKEVIEKMNKIISKMNNLAMVLDDDSWSPNTMSFNYLLSACTALTFSDSIHEAESVMKTMYEKASLCDDSLLNSENIVEMEEYYVIPNIYTFNTLMQVYAKCASGNNNEIYIDKARELLKALLKGGVIYDIQLSYLIRPNLVTINTYLKTLTNSGSAAAMYEAESILYFLMGLQRQIYNLRFQSQGILDDNDIKEILKDLRIHPDPITFSTVLNGLSTCNEMTDCGNKAEMILNQMIEYDQTDSNKVQPTESCHAAVVNSWVNEAKILNDGSKYFNAEAALLRMESNAFQPSKKVVNGLLSIAGLNFDDENVKRRVASRTRGLLSKLLERSSSGEFLKPDVYTFNHVIKANFGFKDEINKREAFFGAIDTFNALIESKFCDANDQTYIHMFKIIQHSMAQNEVNYCSGLCEDLFRKCCQSGLLTNAVLRLAEKMLSSTSIRLLEECKTNQQDKLSVNNLPREWSVNRRVGQNQRRNRNQSWRKH